METNVNSLCFYLRLLLTFCAFSTFFSSLLIHHFCYFMFGFCWCMGFIIGRTTKLLKLRSFISEGLDIYISLMHMVMLSIDVVFWCSILCFSLLEFRRSMFWSTCSLDFQLAYLDPYCSILIWYGSHVLSYSSKPGNQPINVLYYQKEERLNAELSFIGVSSGIFW